VININEVNEVNEINNETSKKRVYNVTKGNTHRLIGKKNQGDAFDFGSDGTGGNGMPKDGSLLHGHRRVPDTEDHENSEHHKICMLGSSVAGSRGIDQEELPVPELPVNLLRGHRIDQMNSFGCGNSKGIMLSDHENKPCCGNSKTGHKDGQENSPKFINAGGSKTCHGMTKRVYQVVGI
jgi:hypothetical protein